MFYFPVHHEKGGLPFNDIHKHNSKCNSNGIVFGKLILWDLYFELGFRGGRYGDLALGYARFGALPLRKGTLTNNYSGAIIEGGITHWTQKDAA